ncbi:MAG: tRNA lysidine(34) synthetase TilS [Candidatus Krumholzibacteriia bacterium]
MRRSPHPLARRVSECLRERCRVPDGTPILVGVSGGSDSVALLRLLVEIAPKHRLHLQVAHFDHRLRPGSADDARFVRKLALDLGLEPHTEAWSQPEPGEDAARRARHAFLERTARRLGCPVIALGHQIEDQIETVLMRLGRGTGLRGLLGIPWRRSTAGADIVRPLLECRRATLADYLESIHQAWREDPSNEDRALQRNRLRHEVLPVLEEALGETWIESWSASIEDLRRIWDWLDSSGAALLQAARLEAEQSCDWETLRRAAEPVRRAALQRWLESAGARDLRRAHLDAAVHLLENGQSGQEIHLPHHLRLVLEQERLTLVRQASGTGREFAIEVSKPTTSGRQIPYELEIEEVGVERARSELAAKVATLRNETHLQSDGGRPGPKRPADSAGPGGPDCRKIPDSDETLVAADLLEPPFEVRHVQPGDRVRLLGAPGSRKIARILQDRRVPRRLRASWPLVVDSGGIVWIPGVGVAERSRLGPCSRGALRLQIRPAARVP